MSLSVGDQLGPYEILALIGKGGMGEVYRARDTKLDREVAIKVLPTALAQDPERLARFEREAKVLASLNHPNIAQIYAVEEVEGICALVMELILGQTLKGPIALDEALSMAAQVADALGAAHEKGITHRDLKPLNVMITPQGVVKVLDFGLAAVAPPSGAHEGDLSQSPTVTISPTRAGMILGTAAYMSPEQARGQSADRRSDIWAFGVLLYETLTGKQLFSGNTVSDILASVLKDEPNLEQVPAKVRPLLRRCLEKEPKKRLQAIGDWELLLSAGEKSVAPERTRRASPLPWIAAAVLAISLIGVSWVAWRATRPVDLPLIRMSVDLGPETVAGLRTTVAISPDSARIVFPIRGADGKQQLGTRMLDQVAATLLPGTENAADPFFSPDGQWVGFVADGKLKKISILGGAAVSLCDAPNMRGGSWNDDGNIIAALNTSTGLSLISAARGAPHTLTKLGQGQTSHRWPQILPRGSAVLFTASTNATQYDDAHIQVLSIKTGEIKTLVRGGYFARYLPTGGSTGHLVYIQNRVLFAVPFDPVKLELRGTAVPVLDDLASDPGTGGGQLDFSPAGIFAYVSSKSSSPSYPVVWLDSSGKTAPLVATPGVYHTPRFSPDGQQLALSMDSAKGRDIYIYDIQRGAMSRLTFTGHGNTNPVWTPDGKHIVFYSVGSFWWIRADGAGEPLRLLYSKAGLYPNSFSRDGPRLVYHQAGSETKFDLWTLPLDLSDADHPKPGKPEVLLRTPFNEGEGRLSPEGRWLSYTSDESGKYEVYVRPFHSSQGGPGGQWQISTAGGGYSFWSRDGRELYYESSDNRIMAVSYVVKGDSFLYAKPRVWSDTQIRPEDVGFLRWISPRTASTSQSSRGTIQEALRVPRFTLLFW
jgi:Tol biopolymer transport system component